MVLKEGTFYCLETGYCPEMGISQCGRYDVAEDAFSRRYDALTPIRLEDLTDEQKDKMPAWTEAQKLNEEITEPDDQMKFYRCMASKRVILLDAEKIGQLKTEFLKKNDAVKTDERGPLVCVTECASNRDVYDFVQNQIKGQVWKTEEIQKIGIFARKIKQEEKVVIMSTHTASTQAAVHASEEDLAQAQASGDAATNRAAQEALEDAQAKLAKERVEDEHIQECDNFFAFKSPEKWNKEARAQVLYGIPQECLWPNEAKEEITPIGYQTMVHCYERITRSHDDLRRLLSGLQPDPTLRHTF